MNFLEIFQALGGNIWFYGGAFILVLSILVFVHEWGHYIVARMAGVKVEVFSIGFGKELIGFDDKNGTRWKFSLIPLGGYVKLFGDMDPASAQHADGVEEGGDIRPFTEEEKKQAFYAQPVWKRALVVFAGPAINYIFAFILLAALFSFNGQPVTPPVAAAVMGESSAQEAGFLPHDRIVSIDGKRISTFEDIRREMMIALDLEKHFVIERNGREIDIYASPKKVTQEDRFGFEHSRGLLGLISPRHAIRVSTITSVNGRDYEEEAQVRQALLSNLDRAITIQIKNGEKSDTLYIKPMAEYNEFLGDEETEEYNFLFLANVDANTFIQYPLLTSLGKAVEESWVITRGTLEALGQMIVGSRSATELGGMIRIGALAGDMAKQGLIALIMFTALLSINLGLINLFPIPMLDGGHLVFYAVEAVLGRPIPEQIQEYAFRVGFALLIGLMVFVNLNDVMQLLL